MNKRKLFHKISLSIIMFCLIIVTSTFYLYSQSELFYLSTDKCFSDTEEASIKIEYINISEVIVTVMKMDNPKEFIPTLPNVTRISFSKNIAKTNIGYYYSMLLYTVKNKFLEQFKNLYNRNNIRSDISETHSELLQDEKPQKNIYVNRIKNTQLIRTFKVNLPQDSGWKYYTIGLGKLGKGSYIIEARNDDLIGHTLVTVSNFGFMVKKGTKGYLINCVNVLTGNPLPKTIVDVVNMKTGKVLFSFTGDKKGIVEIDYAKIPENVLLFAQNNEDAVYYQISKNPSNARDFFFYIYSERPVYKPGDEVNLKGIYKQYSNLSYIPVSKKKLKIKIENATQNVIHEANTESNEYGSFVYNYKIPETAQTGIYTVSITDGDKVYQGAFRVKYYVKPKIELVLSAEKAFYLDGDTVKVALNANYFSGEPANKGKVELALYKTELKEDLMQLEKDIFDDPKYLSIVEYVSTQEVSITNGVGSAELKTSSLTANSDVILILNAKYFDDDSNFAYQTLSLKLYRSEFRLGTRFSKNMYVSGEKSTLSVNCLDLAGKPLSGISATATYYKNSLSSTNKLFSETVESDKKGRITFTYKPNDVGYLIAVVTIKDRRNLEISATASCWIGKEGASYPTASNDILIAFDKQKYQVGDVAKALIIFPFENGSVFYSLERDEIIKYDVVKMDKNSLLLEIPIKDSYAPNIYLTLSSLNENTFYYDSQKIVIPPVSKVLDIQIKTEKTTYSPKSKCIVSVMIKDSKGKPVQAEYSLGVVDASLYQIASSIYPDIRDFFYPVRWNSIITEFSGNQRIYGYSFYLKSLTQLKYYNKDVNSDKLLLAGVKAETKDVRKEFKDLAYWIGQGVTDAKGKSIVSFNFPDNLTKWKIVVIAHTKDGKVANSEISVKTVKEFFVELIGSTYLVKSDKETMFIKITNQTSVEQEVALSVALKNMKSGSILPKTHKIKANEYITLPISLTGSASGKGIVFIKAKTKSIEDEVEIPITILHPSVQSVDTQAFTVNSKEKEITFSLPQDMDMKSYTVNFSLKGSSEIIPMVVDALPFLINYPYGCIEQTTSSFIPSIVSFNAIKKLKLGDYYAGKNKADIISSGLAKLYSYQNADGSWGWWEDQEQDIFMTSYVLYALTLLNRYEPKSVDQKVMDKGLNTLSTRLDSAQNDRHAAAFICYVLAMNKITKKELIQKLLSSAEKANDNYVISLLGLTYYEMNMKKEAERCAKILEKNAEQTSQTAYWKKTGNAYFEWETVIASFAVNLLGKTYPKSSLLPKAIMYLASLAENNIWHSTVQTAFVINNIIEYIDASNFRQSLPQYAITLNGKQIGVISYADNVKAPSLTLDHKTAQLKTKSNELLIGGLKSDPMILSVTLSYFTNSKITKKQINGIGLERKIYKLHNKGEMVFIPELIDKMVSKPGDLYLVELTVNPLSSKPNYMVIEDFIPAGFLPVEDSNSYRITAISLAKKYRHFEFKEGKALFFITKNSGTSFYYIIRANFQGEFYSKPSTVYDMYYPEFFGLYPGYECVISK